MNELRKSMLPAAPSPMYVLSVGVAAAIVKKSVEETLELVYRGELQGMHSFDPSTSWMVTVNSIERYLGYALNITGIQRPQ